MRALLEPSAKRALTPVITGLFFALATLVTMATAVSLWRPGTGLDVMWRIKPTEHLQLLGGGLPVALGFLGLSALMALTSVGCWMRRRWGWALAVAIFVVNGASDAARIFSGARFEGLLGVAIVALILVWLTRPRVSALFRR